MTASALITSRGGQTLRLVIADYTNLTGGRNLHVSWTELVATPQPCADEGGASSSEGNYSHSWAAPRPLGRGRGLTSERQMDSFGGPL